MKEKRHPTPVPTEVNREAQLLAELYALNAALDSNHATMIRFRSEHTATVNGRTAYRVSDLSARAAVDQEWHGYLATACRLIQKRTRVLQEWRALKTSHTRFPTSRRAT